MTIKNSITIFTLLFISTLIKGQTGTSPFYETVFHADSIRGFDETAAGRSAIAEHFSGNEYYVQMFRLKRQYINNKYNLKPVTNYNSLQPAAKAETLAGCINENFEQSGGGTITSVNQINGWTLTHGTNDPTINANANSCNLIGCCPVNPSESALISVPSTGYIDNTIGYQYFIFSVFGAGPSNTLAAASNTQLTQNMFGNKVMRLNDPVNDYSIEKLSKTFSVTSDNALFQFAYISSFSGGHVCCDATTFQFKLTNTSTGSLIACPGFSITPPTTGTDACSANADTPIFYNSGSGTIYTPTNSPGYAYSPWKINSIDLSAYIGQVVTIDFIATDCTAGGHFGYAYIDAQCGPMKLIVNGNNGVFTGNTITLTSCEPTATITAPSNFLSYQWVGPNGLLSSTSVLTTSVSGTYTLTLGQVGSCPVYKIITLAALNITTSDSILCIGNSATLTATGLSNYLWNTGETTSSIVVASTSTGTFTVSGLTGNGYSCAESIVQNVATCTGINNIGLTEKGIIIYPNPNNGEFILKTEHNFKKAELLIENALGQLVYSQPVLLGENKIKTKGLFAGIYYYTLTENKQQVAKGKLKIE